MGRVFPLASGLGRGRMGMDSQHIVVRIWIHEILINESSWRDNTSNFAIVHQPTRLNLLGRLVGELFSNGDVAIQVLDQDLEETVQLEERETGLAITYQT